MEESPLTLPREGQHYRSDNISKFYTWVLQRFLFVFYCLQLRTTLWNGEINTFYNLFSLLQSLLLIGQVGSFRITVIEVSILVLRDSFGCAIWSRC